MMMDRSLTSGNTMREPHVILSLPEVDGLCTRAARGAKYSWGAAEECGRAAAWLAARGFDWAPVLLRRLNGPRGDNVLPRQKTWIADGPVCGLFAGITIADFAALPEGPGNASVEIGRLYDPLLALPFVAQTAVITGQTLCCYLNDIVWAEVSGQAATIIADDLSTLAEASLVLGPVTRSDHLVATSLSETSAITKRNYSALSDIALRMTVPATAASETRAGAVESDND